jgi:hypothetical protein
MINECGAVGGLRIGRGNGSTRREPDPVPLCPPQIPHDLTLDRTQGAPPELWHKVETGTFSIRSNTLSRVKQ